MTGDLDRRGLAALAAGHAAADLCQGSVPALIPFLIAQRHYSYAAAGVLLLCVTVGSSIIQPLFGAVSDRLSLWWLMPTGVLLAAFGIAGAGLTHRFGLTAALSLMTLFYLWAAGHYFLASRTLARDLAD